MKLVVAAIQDLFNGSILEVLPYLNQRLALFVLGIDQTGLTGGISPNNLTLSLFEGNTVISLSQNQILGIVVGMTPDKLVSSLVNVNIGLN